MLMEWHVTVSMSCTRHIARLHSFIHYMSWGFMCGQSHTIDLMFHILNHLKLQPPLGLVLNMPPRRRISFATKLWIRRKLHKALHVWHGFTCYGGPREPPPWAWVQPTASNRWYFGLLGCEAPYVRTCRCRDVHKCFKAYKRQMRLWCPDAEMGLYHVGLHVAGANRRAYFSVI